VLSTHQLFSERVDESTAKFVEAAKAAGVATTSHPHPLPGPEGEPLATTVARIGPERPDRMLVIVSGTHGIEGHAGAAIQTALLPELARSELPRGVGVLFIHQINPWGCAWNRRENEDNVDIFRNLVYTDPPFAANPRYDAYEEGINPRAWTGPERARADAIFQKLIDEHGLDGAIDAIRRGQHSHPKGISYHGQGPSWSRKVVEAIGREHLAGVARVLALDIHTGYGHWGEGLMVPYDKPGTPKSDYLRGRYSGEILEVGSDPLIPDHPRAPYEIWDTPEGPNVLFVGLEYGTHDVGKAFDLFRANTFIHSYGTPFDDFGRKTSADYRELFYPAAGEWRGKVLQKGREVVEESVRAAAGLEAVL
jgi:hypothetical protein